MPVRYRLRTAGYRVKDLHLVLRFPLAVRIWKNYGNNGTVRGSQISGTIDSPQGSVPFTGTKNP